MDKQEKPTTESEKPTTSHHPRLPLLALGLTGVIAVGLFIWKVPQLQVKGAEPKDRIKLENDARGTLVQAIGGLGLFVTGYFGFQNLKVAQENLEETRKKQVKDAEIARDNLAATEEKQVTERFAKAIELLGNTSIHVRLGAIYALERISKDSDKDYWQVMEILTAYVRETSPYPPRDNLDNKPLWARVLSIHQKNNYSATTDSQEDIPPVTTDIQAVLTVIARRAKKYGQGEKNIFDFSKSNLGGADLQRANLQKVNLQEANLQGAKLRGAILEGAFLWGAFLQEANLQGANLQGANLEGANLQEAHLWRANLQGADLEGANLQEAYLREANFQGANLQGANLQEAYPQEANFQGADLEGANLQEANLLEANLQEAILRGANLRRANLLKANLQGANLQGANLQEAYLKEAYLRRAGLQGANLQGANLQEADLQGTSLIIVKNLTSEQLEVTKNWEKAHYEPAVREYLGLQPELPENEE